MKQTLTLLFALLLAVAPAFGYSSRKHSSGSHSHSSHHSHSGRRSSSRHRSSGGGYVFAKEVHQMRGGHMITIRPKHGQALRFKPKHRR